MGEAKNPGPPKSERSDQGIQKWLRFVDRDGTYCFLNVDTKQVLRHEPHGRVQITAIDDSLDDIHKIGQLDSVGSEPRNVSIPPEAREVGDHTVVGSVSTVRSQPSIRDIPDSWEDERPGSAKCLWYDSHEEAHGAAVRKAGAGGRVFTILRDQQTGKFCVKPDMPARFRRNCAKESRYVKVESYYDVVGAASIDHLFVSPTDPDKRLCALPQFVCLWQGTQF